LLRRIAAALIGTTIAALAPPATALAHPLVDEARASYEEADFEGALDALGRAEAADDLVRDDLEAIFELRVLLGLGMADEGMTEQALRRILSLNPAHDFGDLLPPEVLEAAARIRAEQAGALRVRVRARRSPTGLVIAAAVDRDPTGLVRTTRVAARVGTAPWRRVDFAELTLTEPSEPVEFYAELLGPGGVVLASDGSESEPKRWTPPTETNPAEVPWMWIGIGAGAALVTGLVIVVAVVASGGDSDLTNPTLPMVTFE
jgi:hypothetical protein